MIKNTINISGHILEIRQNDDGSPYNFFKDGKKADVLTVDEQKKLKDQAHDAGFMAGLVAATALGKPTSTKPENEEKACCCNCVYKNLHEEELQAKKKFGYIRIDEHEKHMLEEYQRGYLNGRLTMKSEILSKTGEVKL